MSSVEGLTWPRAAAGALAVSAALVLQVSVFPHFAWHGVVPNLVLLVVVGAALACCTEFAMVLGFSAGLLLDLAPPADHVVGRWALALVVVAYVAGRMRTRGSPRLTALLGTVLTCSFVGASVFALTGLLLSDPAVGIPELLQVTVAGLAWDALLGVLVVPLVVGLFDRVAPERAWA